jgi:hypothetical protein
MGYELLDRIGQGQFGEVYRARAPGGVLVAVKRILRALDHEASQRELKVLERVRDLRHPFLLQLHNYYPLQDRLVVVMELADGSLEDRLKECQAGGQPGIPVAELVRYFTEAAEALDFLHAEKLCHRDIKPGNLLRVRGHAKVADFGIARPQEHDLDHTMNVGGTPTYMPPEVWRGDISPHSDQYSLAVTWYEMRTGKRIFPRKQNLIDIANQHLNDTPDLEGVPRAEQKVLLRALAKSPEDRYPSCVAFAQALTEALAPPKPRLPRAGGGWVAAASLALAGLALLVALYLIFRPGPKTSVKADWLPVGWGAVHPDEPLVTDMKGRQYHRQIQRVWGGQTIVLVVVPQLRSSDPRTFYVMRDKVWNDLYAAFLKAPESRVLLKRWGSGQGREELLKDEWTKGARAPGHPEGPRDLGVGGAQGRAPVFRVTATEAECLAEWLGGRLPTKDQYFQAAGLNEETPPPALSGGLDDLAINLGEVGPWTVDRWGRDENQFGCRQMMSNGQEFTRTLQGDRRELPLSGLYGRLNVYVVGKSYQSGELPTREKLLDPTSLDCTTASPEISFRVVLEE